MSSVLSSEEIKLILDKYKLIAVVGLSPKKDRPSFRVAGYMQQAGYSIIPVNPGQSEILGQTCYPDLKTIPGKVEVVNIFRRSELVTPYVQDAIEVGAKVIWMQQGIVNEEAAELAREAGLSVVMDRCIKDDHSQIFKDKSPFLSF